MRAVFTYAIGSEKGKRVCFEADRVTIGRADDNDLSFGDGHRRVSSHHAELLRAGDQFLLRDLGSTNGTMINGRRIITSEVQQDDLIEFGAGGPLLRFALERDRLQEPGLDSLVRANESGFTERTTTKLSPAPASTPSPAHNGLLIAAIIAAMLVGAFGGVFVSRRIQRGDPNYPEIYEANRQSVVFVRIEFELLDSSGQSISTETRTGSGFIVSADGLIATNRHLLRDWEYDAASAGLNGRLTRVDVVLTGYVVEEALPAEVVKLSGTKEVDVALLKIDAPVAIEPVRMPDYDSTRVNPGDRVAVMGYPLGLDPLQRSNDSILEPALTPGAVARVSRESIQLNVRASRGNSGGPVLTRSGEVIGLVTANLSDGNIALCTPISAVVELMK